MYCLDSREVLNRQIVDKCDIAIAVFWTRFGTETEDFGSGTEEEIEKMLKDGKQVFLYFLEKPISPAKINHEQYAKIQSFKERHKGEGLFFMVADESILADQFREHLELYMRSEIQGTEFNKTSGTKMVLWVDDCPENNSYARNILQKYGLKFDIALSTERAMKLMANNKYSLVISDMGRKEGSREGYVLLSEIRNSGNNVPFLIFSAGGSSPEHRKEALEKGAQGSTNKTAEIIEMTLKQLLS